MTAFTPERIARERLTIGARTDSQYLEALDEIERLRSALEWYADQKHYDRHGAPVHRVDIDRIAYDFGEIARFTLSGGTK